MKKILWIALLAGIVVISGCTAGPVKDYTSFTQCVKSAGVIEYGAYWCPNCARVKLTLGDAWKYLNYVECDPKCKPDASGQLPAFCNGFTGQPDQCLSLGVGKYPTWMKNNQILYVGTDLEKVAEVSGCTLPQ